MRNANMLQPPPIRLADVANASYKITTNVLLIMLAREGGREGGRGTKKGEEDKAKGVKVSCSCCVRAMPGMIHFS